MIAIIREFLEKKKPAAKAAPRSSSGSMKVSGKLKSAAKLKTELRSLSMFQEVKDEGKAVSAMIVESTDRNKKPHMYIRFTFGADECGVFFTIPAEVPNPEIRRLEIMKTVFTLVSLLESKGAFLPDRSDLYSKTIEAFDISSGSASADALRMKYELDAFTRENQSMKNELRKLKEENEGLNHELVELEKGAQKLKERIGQLERLTDSELDREIIRWVEDHDGKLNEAKFCESFGIGGQRLEERLDALSKRGVIRIV